MRRASSILPGELILGALLWLDPGITPCVKTPILDIDYVRFLLSSLVPLSASKLSAVIFL